MRDAQRGESPLELRAGVSTIAGGLMAEQSQAIGVESHGPAVDGKGATEVLEVMPGGVSRNKDGGQELTRVVINRKQEGLLIGGRPPLMDRGVMLPQFTYASPLPAAARLGVRRRRTGQQGEVMTRVCGDGFAITNESKAGCQFVGNELVVGRSLERQESLKEPLNFRGPGRAMVAAGKLESESGRMLEPSGSQSKQVSPTDAQELGGGLRVQLAAVEGVERLVQEL